MQSTTPMEYFALFINIKNFLTFYETFFNETIPLFLKQHEVNLKYQRIFQGHGNGNKNIKSC